jgi:hypothetical protein
MKVVVECSNLESLRNQVVVWLEDRVKFFHTCASKAKCDEDRDNFEMLAGEYVEASSFWRTVEIVERS